jgi:hypothetical protein
MPDLEHETYEKIRNTLHRILNENELHLWENNLWG